MNSFWNKRYLIFPIDIILMGISYFLAHLIRYEDLDLFFNFGFFVTMLIVVSSRALVFLFSGIYKSLWAYASLHDLIEIIKFTVISSLFSTVMVLFYNRFESHSRMVLILDSLILLGFLCMRSLSWRLIRENFSSIRLNYGKNTLLIGVDKSAVSLLADLRQNKDLGLRPIGFLDDEVEKQGGEIQRLPVLGGIDTLPNWFLLKKIEYVIIAKPTLSPKKISYIRETCNAHRVELRILPSVTD